MHSEDSNPPTLHQPNATLAEVTTTATPPTHHMNTDSRLGKRTRPISPAPASNPQPTTTAGQTQGQKKQPTAASANKRPNIERPPQPPAAPNQWDSLRASSTTSTTETSGRRRLLILPLPLTNTPKVNGVRTLDSGLRITATPPGGFPTPQLGQSTWRNVSQVLKERWPQKEGAKAWVHTYRAKCESNAQSTVAKLKDAITKIIGDSDAEHLVVSTPTAEVELIERLPPPWHFLISGIPPEAIERLICLQVCSSPEVSCFLFLLNNSCPPTR